MSIITICTHNNTFQADDVFAVAMLSFLHPDHTLVRTRDEGIIKAADIVVDVGGVYDHRAMRYDHHQVGRAGARENGVLYSACGLIWRHYGVEICSLLSTAGVDPAVVAARVDKRLIQPLDATDNGQRLNTGGTPSFEGISQVSLSSVIAGFNPSWHEQHRDFDAQFNKAVALARSVLDNTIITECGTLLAEQGVIKALSARTDKRVLVLDSFLPWQEQAVQDPDVLYAIFPDEAGTWMVQAVPPTLGSFDKRKPLPAHWGGLRNGDFSRVVGVTDGVFCHAGLFICGARTRESALRIVGLALEA